MAGLVCCAACCSSLAAAFCRGNHRDVHGVGCWSYPHAGAPCGASTAHAAFDGLPGVGAASGAVWWSSAAMLVAIVGSPCLHRSCLTDSLGGLDFPRQSAQCTRVHDRLGLLASVSCLMSGSVYCGLPRPLVEGGMAGTGICVGPGVAPSGSTASHVAAALDSA